MRIKDMERNNRDVEKEKKRMERELQKEKLQNVSVFFFFSFCCGSVKCHLVMAVGL